MVIEDFWQQVFLQLLEYQTQESLRLRPFQLIQSSWTQQIVLGQRLMNLQSEARSYSIVSRSCYASLLLEQLALQSTQSPARLQKFSGFLQFQHTRPSFIWRLKAGTSPLVTVPTLLQTSYSIDCCPNLKRNLIIIAICLIISKCEICSSL
ncbi:hypothetical protein FGO68_gene14848 [Halteria grandinella]|uniref:Uncharacterized protein n=1 Tax=Halteria grandinella TaxID=5974 RepID=A0A8J8SXF6_HALGN|nr:hypothetical protein FGO68_gene14848 [Halteria grandinella]